MTGIASLGRPLTSHSLRPLRTYAPRVQFPSSCNSNSPARDNSSQSSPAKGDIRLVPYINSHLTNFNTKKHGINHKVLHVAKKHDIGFSKELKRIRYKLPPAAPNTAEFVLSLSRKHLFDSRILEYFEDHEHPYCQTILDNYIEHRETRPFWFYVHATASTPKNCVWKEAEKRLRRALVHVLADRGYDYNGRHKMGGNRGRNSDGHTLPSQLLGTAKIYTGDPQLVCNIKSSKIRARLGPLMDRIEHILGADDHGKHVYRWLVK